MGLTAGRAGFWVGRWAKALTVVSRQDRAGLGRRGPAEQSPGPHPKIWGGLTPPKAHQSPRDERARACPEASALADITHRVRSGTGRYAKAQVAGTKVTGNWVVVV